MSFKSKIKTLEYHSADQELGFLVFFALYSEPDIVKVYGLVKNIGKNGEKETFDDEVAYDKMLEDLSKWMSLHALAERNTRFILSLNESPIRLNTYDSFLAEKITEQTENMIKRYLQ